MLKKYELTCIRYESTCIRHMISYMMNCFIGISILLSLSACGQTIQARTLTDTTKAKPTVRAKRLPTVAAPPIIEQPVRISIPSIGVNATIEPVGILSSGNLDTPHTNPWDSTGWYDHGVRPGDMGSAVIDGHVDRPGGGPAIFWNLRYMEVGQEITITTSSHQLLHFYVTRRVAYPADQAPLQAIFGDRSGNHLNLITCAGDWIPSEGQTSARMVVFANLGTS